MGRPGKASRFTILVGAGFRKSLLQSLFVTLITWFGGPTPGAAQSTVKFPVSPLLVYVTNTDGGGTKANSANSGSSQDSSACVGIARSMDCSRHLRRPKVKTTTP
jgi:hypothetical protein